MKAIKVNFSDFWGGFNPYKNFFTNVLSKQFNIEISSNPDILIHSVYGNKYMKFKGIRVCFTGENKRPDFSRSDYHIGFDHNLYPNYLRWPLFLIMTPPHFLTKKSSPATIKRQHIKFANFIYSNYNAKERQFFFHQLNTYKKVDSGGKVLNNLGYLVQDKLAFISNYKFTIAFENEIYPGYTTEKLTQPMKQNSIPIYWGNREVGKDFNKKSFIHVNDFGSFSEAIQYIKEIDNNEKLYNDFLKEPYFKDNKIPEKFHYKKLYDFFENIFSELGRKTPVAKWWHPHFYYYMRIRNTTKTIYAKIRKNTRINT